MLTSFSIHPTASDLELLNLLTVILKENVGTIQPNVPMKLDHNDVETSYACGDNMSPPLSFPRRCSRLTR